MTAAFACAKGRDANQVNRLFSANPVPHPFAECLDTSAHGNQRSIIRVVTTLLGGT